MQLDLTFHSLEYGVARPLLVPVLSGVAKHGLGGRDGALGATSVANGDLVAALGATLADDNAGRPFADLGVTDAELGRSSNDRPLGELLGRAGTSDVDLVLLDHRSLVAKALSWLLGANTATWVGPEVLDLTDVTSSLLDVSEDNSLMVAAVIHKLSGGDSCGATCVSLGDDVSLDEGVLGDEEAAASLLHEGVLEMLVAALLIDLVFDSGTTSCLPSDRLDIIGICVESNLKDFIDWV